jgi:hypothetical protein
VSTSYSNSKTLAPEAAAKPDKQHNNSARDTRLIMKVLPRKLTKRGIVPKNYPDYQSSVELNYDKFG